MTAVALAAAALLTYSTVAFADPSSPTYPSQSQVDAARATATSRADDVAAIQARLAAANSRLEAAATRAEVASEAWNGARWRLDQARRAAVAARQAADRATARVDAQRVGIATLVTQSYQDGTAFSGVTAFLGEGGPVSVMKKYGVAQSAGTSMKVRLDEFAILSAKADAARAEAQHAAATQRTMLARASAAREAAASAARSAQAEAAAIATTKDHLIARLAAAQHVSVELARTRQAALDEQAQERAAAAAAAAAKPKPHPAAAPAPAPAPAPDPAPAPAPEPEPAPAPGPAPAPHGGAQAAIDFAKQQLGEPYQWGAAGPDSWDCSGLTMMSWRAGGVSLPHYSAAQYYESSPIGVNDLRPGDLVFWGDSPDSIHHVAMYLGNGQIIHAPRTGQPVQISSMYYWIPPNYFARP